MQKLGIYAVAAYKRIGIRGSALITGRWKRTKENQFLIPKIEEVLDKVEGEIFSSN